MLLAGELKGEESIASIDFYCTSEGDMLCKRSETYGTSLSICWVWQGDWEKGVVYLVITESAVQPSTWLSAKVCVAEQSRCFVRFVYRFFRTLALYRVSKLVGDVGNFKVFAATSAMSRRKWY